MSFSARKTTPSLDSVELHFSETAVNVELTPLLFWTMSVTLSRLPESELSQRTYFARRQHIRCFTRLFKSSTVSPSCISCVPCTSVDMSNLNLFTGPKQFIPSGKKRGWICSTSSCFVVFFLTLGCVRIWRYFEPLALVGS